MTTGFKLTSHFSNCSRHGGALLLPSYIHLSSFAGKLVLKITDVRNGRKEACKEPSAHQDKMAPELAYVFSLALRRATHA